MKKADKFIQPMEHTGLPNTASWAGYDWLQWTGSLHHPGIDYNWGAGEQDKGKPALNVGNGIVDKTINWNGVTKGFGNQVFVKHILAMDIEIDGVKLKAGDIIYSHFAHLDTIIVKEGQEIDIGTQVGTVGGTGGWPSHLHFEIRLPIGKGYGFWPVGYSAEWISSHYLDPYQFIEKYKTSNTMNEDEMLIKKETFTELVTKSTQWDDTSAYFKVDPKNTKADFVIEQYGNEKERKEQLERDLQKKNKTIEELDGKLSSCDTTSSARKETLEYIANKLGVSADESVLKGEIEDLISVEDKLNKANKTIEDMEKQHENEKKELLRQIELLRSDVDKWKGEADGFADKLNQLEDKIDKQHDDEEKTNFIKLLFDEIADFFKKLSSKKQVTKEAKDDN